MTETSITRFKILTLHPDPLVRAGIAASLRQHGAFDVFEGAPESGAWNEQPFAVVIADYRQALHLTEVATQSERRHLPSPRILVLTANDRETEIRRAIEAGVHGYVLLGGPVVELIEGVTALAHGGRYVGHSAAQRMMESLTQVSVTARESDVLKLVVAGESNKAIARRLQIEVGTVKTHIAAILSKLRATSRTQAAAIAVARGLVEDRAPAPPAPYVPHRLRTGSMTQHA